jgi:shikimate kinase
MLKSSVALIGFMGTGKTTIGKLLAIKLGKPYQFIEMDQIIEEMAGKTLQEIFSQDGEKSFRKFERMACLKVSKLENHVISCGGGVVLDKRNIRNLQKNSYIILLKASTREIYNRVINEGINIRPLINKANPKEEIEKLYTIRSSIYESAADLEINTTDKDLDDIVDEIIEKLKTRNHNS